MGSEVTLKHVAEAAKVSPTTVSNFLNGHGSRMSPRTRKRVMRVIDELGYRPSRVARQLRTGRAQVLGLVVPSVANPFWGSFALAVEAEALRRQQQVLLCNSERDLEREKAYVEELWASGVKAVVLGSSLPSLDYLAPILERGLRVIAFDRERQPGDPETLVSVSVDSVLGGRLVTQHLLELGHRRIGFVSGPIATVSRRGRLAGYREALKLAGVRFRRQLVWDNVGSGFGDVQSAELGRRGMEALLTLPDPPTAVVAINDMYAIGACAAIRDAGLDVPGIAVAGFDDIVIARLYNPPLTTVRQPLQEMVRFIFDTIDDEATGRHQKTSRSMVMAPELIVRASTALPMTPSSVVRR